MLSLPNVDFGALPPEVNASRILPTGGPAPMMAASSAIAAMAGSLETMAGVAQSSMAEMASTYRSAAADQAQHRFGMHTGWFQQQAAVAEVAVPLIAKLADAYFFALMTMPPVGVIAANRIATFSLTVSNVGGQNTPAIAANEAAYYQMWIQAQAAMYKYAGEAISALGALPPPIPPPPPIAGGPGAAVPPATAVGTAGTSGTAGGSAGSGSSGGGQVGGGAADSGAGSTVSGSNAGADPMNTATDFGQSMAPVADSGADVASADAPVDGGASASGGSPGFFGTSSFSPTLAGLNGGVGSMVALGMGFGGPGGMTTAANQFRMPSSWTGRPAATFGAQPPIPAAAPIGRAAPPGAGPGGPGWPGPPAGFPAPRAGPAQPPPPRHDKMCAGHRTQLADGAARCGATPGLSTPPESGCISGVTV
ncbi:PPE family protein [Nocardia brasiliensis]|uniref:PPE family protein n=1 Tax=Nocardia brasiliensis TaxID=37326 RepID=UPI00245581DB|nr:PPE family protein [Nocardia brasiliensis]